MEEDLPDIPYTPMRDISDQPGSSSSPTGKVKEIGKQDIQYLISGSPDQKRPRVLTAAEKKARYRANRSAALKAEELKRRKEARQNQTQEEKDTAKEKEKARIKNLRDNQTQEEKETAKEKQKAGMKNLRDNQTAEEKDTAKEKDKVAKKKLRQQKQAGVEKKEALLTDEILAGTHPVPDLKDTVDTIGRMDTVCEFCGAMKFKKETGSICCSNGKVCLDPLPQPPEQIDKLWRDNTPEGRLFRQHARSINNAVCLTSIKGKTRTFGGGFTPSIVYEGRVSYLAGPLQAAEGEKPCFAQLYVHDPSLETGLRLSGMTIAAGTSEKQRKILQQVLVKVQSDLHKYNPFVRDFKQIVDMDEAELGQGKIVISAKARPTGEHERRYNDQLNLQEVSILTNSQPHDLVLQCRGGKLQNISDLNPKGMPLHFTLLFPHGTYGWDPSKLHRDGKRRVTTREFYAYYMNQRGELDYLRRGRKLYQEWICISWLATENQKLEYQRRNQKALRADSYKNVREATEERRLELAPREDGMFADDNHQPAIGRKILSSSFVGSPRWYNSQFQDGMAIVREYHKPDYFLTMTCNSKWPEITENLEVGQSAQDRPDLVARVFKQKKDQLMNDLISGEILGKVVAHMHVIEFQKRGLPHAHILIILANEDRTTSPEEVDQAVCAELPPDPEVADTEEEAKERRRLQDIVTSNMVHGPCGTNNPNCPCMENGRCTKNYPKPFQKKTIVDPESNNPIYRRRSPADGGRQIICPKTGHTIDNRWIVPYNPFLSKRYNCHINNEKCTSAKASKYLYKYVTKGSDRAMVATVEEGQTRDEIRQYEDLRSVGSSEAAWHLMAFPIAKRYPPVQTLRVHLEDQQQVVFDEGTEEEALERQRETELTAFFLHNAEHKEREDVKPTYIDMPKLYRYDKSKKQWIRRKARSEDTMIGRVHTINPLAGEAFYLRILLHNDHCRGKTSFEDMRTLDSGKVCETYQEVCRELGLLRDDHEWQQVLEEAAGSKLCAQIRELYVVILMFCHPSNPRGLFDEFWQTWTDDYELKGRRRGTPLDENQLKTMVLLDLELRLQSFEKELASFGLPQPSPEDLARVENITSTDPVVIREEKDYHVDDLRAAVEETAEKFTEEQAAVFETVMAAVREGRPLCAFIDARGGCGKTFIINAILAAVRSLETGGCVALAMATTGIAANLLDLGRTFHSRLKAPLTPHEESTLQISGQSSLAKLVQMAKLLLVDEAPMLDRFLLEALDRSLRDLMGQPDQPFGGKIILLAGDFRQCLPVVPGSNRAGTVSHCINQSHLWPNFQHLRLTVNMRVRASGDPVLEEFDKWTLDIGNGTVENEVVSIPAEMLTEIKPNTKEEPWREAQTMKKFCQLIFPDIQTNYGNPGWFEGRAILAPTNKEVDSINELMQGCLPGAGIKMSSADTLENPTDVFRFNTEYLNTLQPNGFPQHKLDLKPGMPLMLLRNINPRQGLCNGTRLTFQQAVNNKLLECRIVGSDRVVLIPRITFIPKPGEYPFEWQRRQFPVRPAYAITINKAQGQTLKKVGVWLRGQVFGHGQLYVACSRVSSPGQLKFAVMGEPGEKLGARNVVFHEVLLREGNRTPA